MTSYHEAINHWNSELDIVDALIHEVIDDPKAVAELVRQASVFRQAMKLEHAFYSPSYNPVTQ